MRDHVSTVTRVPPGTSAAYVFPRSLPRRTGCPVIWEVSWGSEAVLSLGDLCCDPIVDSYGWPEDEALVEDVTGLFSSEVLTATASRKS